MNLQHIIVYPVIAALLMGCAINSIEEQVPEGFVAINNSVLDKAWIHPDFYLSHYEKLLFEEVTLCYKPVESDSEYEVEEKDRRRLEAILFDAFENAFTDIEGYELTSMPDNKTLKVFLYLVDITSNVPEEKAGRTKIYIDRVGSAGLELEVQDARTGQLLAYATDKQIAEDAGPSLQRSSCVQNWACVRRDAKSWAKRLKAGIEELLNTQQ